MPKKGQHHTEETREKIRIARSKQIIPTGWHPSEATRNKQSAVKIGDKNPFFGKHHSETTLQKMRKPKSEDWIKGMLGEENPNWKGGISTLAHNVRCCYRYDAWVLAIFHRDNFTCQKCRRVGGKLEAHHIKAFSKIFNECNITTFEQAMACDELWDLTNGITFCKKCHADEHKTGGKPR